MMETIHMEDAERKQHWVSHCGKIIFFQSKESSEYSAKASEILFSSLSFDQGGNTFLRANDGAAVINRTRSFDIVTCKCVFDVQKRVTTPCILLVHRSKRESFKYSLLTLSCSNRLEPHMEFQLPYQIQQDVGILSGPIVIWRHAAVVFYTSLQTPEVRQIPARLSQIIIGVLPLHKEQVFFLGLQNSSEECMTDASSSHALGYLPDNGQMFDGSLILPRAYCSITKSMLVLSAEENNGVLKTIVVAATRKKQLVYFESGIPKEVCQLPFEEPEDIQLVNTGRDGSLFVIYFDQGHVCAVWKETFQVASCWSGVSSVHVDDFLGRGTDQMLLVFAEQVGPGHALENFLITDLCGTTYSRSQDSGDVPKTSLPAQENYLLTLQALESRLQSGLNLLQDLQRDVRVKERVIHQSVQSLTDVVSGRRPVLSQYEEEGLTSLWDGSDEPEIEAFDNERRDVPAVPSKPQVDKLWHRVIEDRLVVGVILTTDGSRPVGSVSLSVSTETGQRSVPAVIQTHSQVFRLPTLGPLSPTSPSTRLEPAAKKSRRDSANTPSDSNAGRLAVTAVTDLTPLLNSGCVKCLVVLHYLHTQESSALVHDPTPFVLHCGHVPLDAQRNTQTRLLNDSKLTTDEVREDLLCLLAVLNRWILHIDSPDHSLKDVDGWIQRTMGCERLEVDPQYLLSNPSGPAALMLFHWQQTTPFQGDLVVHCSHLRMLQFLDTLLGSLPASCSVKSLRDLGTCRTTRVLPLALEEEVLSLKDGVSSLLCCKDEEWERTVGARHQETPEPHSVQGLRRCREDWDMDLKRSKTRLSPLVDIGSYRRLTQKLFKVKLEGDLAVLLESQRT